MVGLAPTQGAYDVHIYFFYDVHIYFFSFFSISDSHQVRMSISVVVFLLCPNHVWEISFKLLIAECEWQCMYQIHALVKSFIK